MEILACELGIRLQVTGREHQEPPDNSALSATVLLSGLFTLLAFSVSTSMKPYCIKVDSLRLSNYVWEILQNNLAVI